MAIGIRCAVLGTNTGGSATVSANTVNRFQGTAPQAGDLALNIYFNNFYTLANMGTPSGGPTWSAITNGTADAGTNGAHIKSYTGPVTSGGDFTASATESGSADEEKGMLIVVLSGADTTTPIDVAANATGTSDNSNICPSASPATSDAWLFCFTNSGGGNQAASYTHPGGMTELQDNTIGSGESCASAYEQLAASGATGTRTFTPSTAVPYAAVTITVRTATGGAPPVGAKVYLPKYYVALRRSHNW